MATCQLNGAMRAVRRALLCADGGGLTDGWLLRRFLNEQDEAAFEALVKRHGSMVFGVCRRVLRHNQDAEDAFQATFLVLARKAATLAPREQIGNWLYGVAFHVALKARAAAMKRRIRESQLLTAARGNRFCTPTANEARDWLPLLDQELSRLPVRYREAVVLCELRGQSRRQAATQLGIPEGTLSSRLATARKLLARRLGRHGMPVTAGTLLLGLAANDVAAAPPHSLVGATVRAAGSLTRGMRLSGLVSLKVATLVEGVTKGMFSIRFTLGALGLCLLGLVWASFHAHAQPVAAQESVPAVALASKATQAASTPEQPTTVALRKQLEFLDWVLTEIDSDRRAINLSQHRRGDAHFVGLKTPEGLAFTGFTLQALPVAAEAKILVDRKEGQFGDLKPGMRLSLSLAADLLSVSRIDAVSSPTAPTYVVKAIDAEKNTLSVTTTLGNEEVVLESLPLAEDAKITFLNVEDSGDPRLPKITNGGDGKLTDLRIGSHMALNLVAESASRLVIKSLHVRK